jgi:hypothetical protein
MLAERLLRHYAEASGVQVAHFRAASRAVVAVCLNDMGGEDAAKEMRLRAVIDDAIAESRARGVAHPPIAFVFSLRHVRRRLERLAEAEHVARKAQEGDMFAEGFDRALTEAHAELANGGLPDAALERARPFVEAGRVRDAKRVDALAKASEPHGKDRDRIRKPRQDAPARESSRWAAESLLTAPGGVYAHADALRALRALLGEDEAPLPSRVPHAEIPLTPAERTALETAQELARARWARAG